MCLESRGLDASHLDVRTQQQQQQRRRRRFNEQSLKGVRTRGQAEIFNANIHIRCFFFASIHRQGWTDEKIKERNPRRLHNSQTLWRPGVGHSWLMSQFMSRSGVIIQHNISPLQQSPKWDCVHAYSGAHVAWNIVSLSHSVSVIQTQNIQEMFNVRLVSNDCLSISPLKRPGFHFIDCWIIT